MEVVSVVRGRGCSAPELRGDEHVALLAGDFALGLRSRSRVSVRGDFATGARTQSVPLAYGDFATGFPDRAVAALPTGSFATGARAYDDESRRQSTRRPITVAAGPEVDLPLRGE